MDKFSLLKEFDEALGQEIEYIKTTGGDAKFILRNGQLVYNDGGKFIYEFVTDTPIELDDDTPINIKYGNESVSGSIITINGLKVLLSLDKDVGRKVPEIVITASAYFLLEILQEMISNINSKKLPFNEDIAMKAFGFLKSTTAEDYNFLTPFTELKLPISEEQKDALAKSLGSEITFIWGPPGTGKTTLLSYLANELLLREQSILLVSHTNVAIDNALERIATILKQRKDEKYFNGTILRIGNSSNTKLFENYPELKLDYWIEEKGRELNEELRKLEEKQEKEKALFEEFNYILKLFTSLEETERKINKIRTDIETTKKDLKNTRDNLSQIKKKINETKNKLEKAKNAGFFIRLITGLNPKKLGKKLTELFSSLTKESYKLSKLQRKLDTQIRNLQGAEEDYNKYQNELIELSKKNNLKIEKISEEIGKQQLIIKEINQQIDNIKRAIQQLTHSIIKEAKLIGTTITKVYLNQDIYSRKFDTVIVDEASMAPLPALFFNCGLATSKVIIIGDFRQLGPIAMSDDNLVQKWLRRDIFEVSGITIKVNEKEKEERLAILREQRRMPEKIAELVNRPIYNGILKSAKKPPIEDKQEKKVIQSQPFPNEEIILCDTSEFNPWCVKSPIRRSPFNVYSAFLSVYLAEQALLNGVKNIAILTPYRAQNNLIHKMVADKGLEEGVFPASVHRFQGKESDLVIFDLVEGPLREIKWLGGGFDTEAMRVINVAITRAKAKIIFVANLNYLKNKLKGGSILKQILEQIEKNYPVINTQKFFPFIRIPIKKADFIKLDAVPTFCDQTFFYKAFQNDLLKAEDKVIIISPFITIDRLVSFESVFRELYRKGVKIFIITKPFKEQKMSQEIGKEVTDVLRKLDIDLITRPLSHEKLAIIDGKIIWHGSLNILSHKNTTELMVRFTTKESKFSDEVLKLCGVNIPQILQENIINRRIEKLNKSGVGFCSFGHPLIIRRGSRGIFLSCSKFPSCKDRMPLTLDIIREVFGKKYLYCEKCGSPMEIKFNPKRKNHFLGCSKYPNCRFTRPL